MAGFKLEVWLKWLLHQWLCLGLELVLVGLVLALNLLWWRNSRSAGL